MSKLEALLSNPYHSKCFDHTLCLYNKNEKNEVPSLVVGDRVISRNDTLGYFYSGKVTKTFECVCPLECKCHYLHVNVKLEDDSRQKNVSSTNVLKFTEISSSYIIAGDHVMASVINEYDQRCFVPGIVQAINEFSTPKLYTVLYFNGQENYNLRNELIKICKKKYAEITNYIRTKLGIESVLRTENTEKPPETPRPDMDAFKIEIISEIKNKFDSLNLENKYQVMYDEFIKFKSKNKSINNSLDVNLRTMKKELDDLKYSGPGNGKTIPFQMANGKNNNTTNNSSSQPDYKKTVLEKPVELTYEEKIMKLRSELSELKRGDEVLAKSPHTGWYYRRMIEESEDIVFIQESNFEIGDPVVAMHPHHENCYGPGQVVSVSDDLQRVKIRFYDFIEAVVSRIDCFPMYKIKFQADINNIFKLEKKYIGKFIVMRNNATNIFDLGKINSFASDIIRQQYVVEWNDNVETLEKIPMFGPNSQNLPVNVKDFVLALNNSMYYYPGRVTHRQGNQLVVEFFNGEIDENVDINECFLISKEYYKLACKNFNFNDTTQASLVELLPEESRPAELLEKKEIYLTNKYKAQPKYEKRDTPVIDARQFYSEKSGRINKHIRYQS